MSYFPQPYTRSKNKIKLELDFSSYATKSDLKNATGGDNGFAKMVDLASLKITVDKLDKLDSNRLKSAPVD